MNERTDKVLGGIAVFLGVVVVVYILWAAWNGLLAEFGV